MYERPVLVPVTNLLSEYRVREVEWLWPGRVPIGRVTMVCGDPGVGKSLVMMDVAARVTGGISWPEEWLRVVAEASGVVQEAAHGSAEVVVL